MNLIKTPQTSVFDYSDVIESNNAIILPVIPGCILPNTIWFKIEKKHVSGWPDDIYPIGNQIQAILKDKSEVKSDKWYCIIHASDLQLRIHAVGKIKDGCIEILNRDKTITSMKTSEIIAVFELRSISRNI